MTKDKHRLKEYSELATNKIQEKIKELIRTKQRMRELSSKINPYSKSCNDAELALIELLKKLKVLKGKEKNEKN